MVKVYKHSGLMEDFDKAKLKASLKKAGAKDEHATKVAERIEGRVREEMTTAEIKRMAAAELRKMDPRVAQSYETFREPTT